MDFYLGKNIQELNVNDNCVSLSDELLEYLSANIRNIPLDLTVLFSIDPYHDEVVYTNEIYKLFYLCEGLEELNLPNSEFKKSIVALKKMTEIAIKTNCNIISLGD